jgi:trimeric autotransporter adhesin
MRNLQGEQLKLKSSSRVLCGVATALLALSLFGTTMLFRASAQPALSLDSAASTSCNGCRTQSTDLTVKQGDLVVALVTLSPESVYSRISGAGYDAGFLSSLTSSGMLFQQRFAYTANPGSGDGSLAWEEWAVASSTGTAAVTGTVNSTDVAWSMITYSITGANTTRPFDTNPSMPVWDFNDCNATDGCSVTYSTSNPNEMVLAMIGSEGGPRITAPPGYTLIAQSSPNGWQTSGAAYLTTSSTQMNAQSGSWSLSPGESAVWFVDAVRAASGVSSTTSTTTSSSSLSTTTTTSSTITTSSSSTATSGSQSASSSTASTSATSSTRTSSSSTSTSSTEQITTEVSTCVVTFTLSAGNVTGWSGAC